MGRCAVLPRGVFVPRAVLLSYGVLLLREIRCCRAVLRHGYRLKKLWSGTRFWWWCALPMRRLRVRDWLQNHLHRYSFLHHRW
jgi:hypothetical protein